MSSRPVDPRTRALQMNAGSQINALLNPIRPASKAGPKAPNHALANKQALKAAQVRNALKREEEEAKAAEAPFKMARFRSVESVLSQKRVDGTLGLGAPRGDQEPGSVRRANSGTSTASAARRTAGGAGGLTGKMGSMSIGGRGPAAAAAPRGGSRGAQSQQQHPQQRYDDEADEEDLYSPQGGRHQQEFDDDREQYDDGQQQQYQDEGGYDDEAQDYSPPQQQQQHRSPQQQQRGRQQQQYDDGDDDGGQESLYNLAAGRGAPQQQQPQSRGIPARGTGGISALRMPSGGQGIAPTQQQQHYQQDRDRDSVSSSGRHGEGRSFIQENAKRVIASSRALASARSEHPSSYAQERESESATLASGSSIPAGRPISKHESYGKVPKYIQDRQAAAAEAAAREAEAKREKEQGVPPGMVLMPEEQRLNTLAVLQENHKKILNDLAAFPLRVETASRKRAKAELEAKLEEIEKALQLFGRKRVLIQP